MNVRMWLHAATGRLLVLNKEDPWAETFYLHDTVENDPVDGKQLPGLVTVPGDPTVENLARWIAEWACINFFCDVICSISETATNGASVQFHWNGFGASMMR